VKTKYLGQSDYRNDLATLTPQQLADKYGGTHHTHSKNRRRLSITGPSTPIPGPKFKTEDWHARLGKEPDSAIARDMGVTPNAILSLRRRRSIPAFVPPDAPAPTADNWQARAGKVSDLTIAKEHGVYPGVVWRYRAAHNIPPSGQSGRKMTVTSEPWHEHLSTMTAATIAEKWNVDIKHVKYMRARLGLKGPNNQPVAVSDAPWLPLLGGVSDKEIARRFGVGVHRVSRTRTERNIAPYVMPKQEKPQPTKRVRAPIQPTNIRPMVKRPVPTTTVRDRLRQREDNPNEKAPVRPEMILPTAPAESACTFDDRCRCFFCRPSGRRAA
jgi:hypothetical protein